MKRSCYLIFTLILAFSFVAPDAIAKKKHTRQQQKVAAAAMATALIVARAKEKQRHKHHHGYKYDNHWDNRQHRHDNKKGQIIAAGVAAAAIATAVIIASKNKQRDNRYDDYGPDAEWDPVYKSVVGYPRHNVKCFDNTRLCYWTTDSGLLKGMSREWTKEVY